MDEKDKGLIFISFVGEGIMNPAYHEYVAGRIEVSRSEDIFPSEEIRYITKMVDEFRLFDDLWDMKHVTEEQLDFVRDMVESKFYDRVDLTEE